VATIVEEIAAIKARLDVLEVGAPPADLSSVSDDIAAVADRVTALETRVGEPVGTP
jgi:hypothetical protein